MDDDGAIGLGYRPGPIRASTRNQRSQGRPGEFHNSGAHYVTEEPSAGARWQQLRIWLTIIHRATGGDMREMRGEAWRRICHTAVAAHAKHRQRNQQPWQSA